MGKKRYKKQKHDTDTARLWAAVEPSTLPRAKPKSEPRRFTGPWSPPNPVVPDPGMSAWTPDGRELRVLARTDGKFIVYDETLPLGERSVGGRAFNTAADAVSHTAGERGCT